MDRRERRGDAQNYSAEEETEHMSPFDHEIRNTIAAYGFMVLGVGGGPDTPTFSYTIGLSEKFGFELIAIGLNPQTAHAILNHVAQTLGAGEAMELGKPDERFANLPVIFRECDTAKVREWAVQAFEHYEKDVPFRQLVLCDRKGLFPEDPAYDLAHMGPLQKLLYAA